MDKLNSKSPLMVILLLLILSMSLLPASLGIQGGIQGEWKIPSQGDLGDREVRTCAPSGGGSIPPEIRANFAKGVSQQFINLGMATDITLISATADTYNITIRKPDNTNSTLIYNFSEPGRIDRVFGDNDIDFMSRIDTPGMYIATVVKMVTETENGVTTTRYEPRGSTAFYATDGLSVRPYVLNANGSESGRFGRGETIVIEALIYYPTTEKELSSSDALANVTVSNPEGGLIQAKYDPEKLVWRAEYTLSNDAPLGNWVPEITAKDSGGNSGSQKYPYTIQILDQPSNIILTTTSIVTKTVISTTTSISISTTSSISTVTSTTSSISTIINTLTSVTEVFTEVVPIWVYGLAALGVIGLAAGLLLGRRK